MDRIAARLAQHVPGLQKLHQRLGEALQDQREQNAAFKQLQGELSLRRQEAEERLQGLKELRTATALCMMPQAECVALAESVGKQIGVSGEVVLKERLWELELALEDRGWVREVTLATLEFSRTGVQQLIRICRVYGIKNPIVKRIAEINELYVFGRGIEIRSDDPSTNDAIQRFLAANDAEMGHNGLAQKERDVQTDGAQYFGLATDPKGNVRVIMIDPLEIIDIITDPEDSAHPRFYRRQWQQMEIDYSSGRQSPKSTQCWYPALEWLQSEPDIKPMEMGGIKVNWAMPILRDSAGACPAKWRWPVPSVFAVIDWARGYKDGLEDYATVRRTMARFALMIETKGGPGAIAAYNALFSTSFANGSGTQTERNPPPLVGSTHTSGPGNKIEAFKSAGAQSNPEELRRILLMCCCAAGLPDTFLGDLSQGSLATATSLDRPTELKFTAIQRRWTHTLTMILTYVVQVSSSSPGGVLKEARKDKLPSKPANIIVKFPNVIEHSIKDMIGAIVDIGTLGGRQGVPAGIIDRRRIADLLLAEVGVENRDEALDEMGYGKDYDPAADIEDQRTQAPPQDITGTDPDSAPTPGTPKPGAPKPKKEALRKAVDELKGAVLALNGKH